MTEKEISLTEYEQILKSEMDEVGYIIDYDTYQLLYLNDNYKSENNIVDADYLGKTCFNFLYNLDYPCKNCKNQLLELNKSKSWHKYSEDMLSNFIVKDKLIELNGRRVVIQTAFNITNKFKVLQDTITYDKAMIECSKTLLDDTPFEVSIYKLLKILCDFYGADSNCIFERNYDKGISDITHEYHSDISGVCSIYNKKSTALFITENDDWTRFLLIQDYLFLQKNDSITNTINATQYHKRFTNSDKNNVLIAPLKFNDKLLGAIEITNLTNNLDNFELILTISAFVVNNLNNRNINEMLKKTISYHERTFATMQDLSNDILFKINLKDRVLIHQDEKAVLFGMPSHVPNFPDSVEQSGSIHPDELKDYMSYARKMCEGIGGVIRTRIKCVDDNKPRFEWFEISSKAIVDDDGNPIEIIGKLTNIQTEVDMKKRATIDNLTGALNKLSFQEITTQLFAESNPNDKHALLFIDLDDFKSVNDNYGHSFGDFLLKTVGKRLQGCVHRDDVVGRVGGDEFVILLKHIQNNIPVSSVANRVLKTLSKPIVQADISYNMKCSIGVSIYPTDATNYDDIYNLADKALYFSKNNGKNIFTFYNEL